MKIYRKKSTFLLIFEIFIFFCYILQNEFVKGSYESKGYPLIHLMNNNEYTGSANNFIKNNLINLLYIYKDVIFDEEKTLGIDSFLDIEDDTKIERLIKEKMLYINKYINSRQMIKYSGFIYLYEIIEKKNFYFLLHFLMTNNNNGLIIILPEDMYINVDEYYRINKINKLNDQNKKNKVVSQDLLEKRIMFVQSLILNMKLQQSIYFIKNNKDIEKIYENYQSKFAYFDLTRNVSISPISKIQNVYKMNSKSLYYFLNKNNNIHINTIFNKQQDNQTFLLTKQKTIIICADFNVFNIFSDFPSNTTFTNSNLITIQNLIKLFYDVYNKEQVNYNILFFFTNYYYGIQDFLNSINVIFKENIEFVICLDNLNNSDFYIYESNKTQPQNVQAFYRILNNIVKGSIKKNVQMVNEKIKIHSKHLPSLHEYFVLNKINSFSLSSSKKNNNMIFLNKFPMLQPKLNIQNVKNNIAIIFKSLYLYMTQKKTDQKENTQQEQSIEKNEKEKSMLTYINKNMSSNDDMNTIDYNLNKYNKFFIYKEDTLKLFNYFKTIINSNITDTNFLIKDYKLTTDKKQKFFYQKYAHVTFSMAISYVFHYVHLLFVVIFLVLVYICVNYYFVPMFYKNKIKAA